MRPGLARFAPLLALLASACIPPSPNHPGRQPPRMETDMETVFGERPVWEAEPVEADASPVSGSSYVVKPGDTLSSIGERSGAGLDAIAQANGIKPPYPLRVGQQLQIPAGRYHRVEAGDTGIAIARAYGISWQSIISANSLAEPFLLRVGQRLIIPGSPAGSSPSTDMETRAASFRLDIDDILTGGEPAQDLASEATSPLPVPTAPLPPTVAVREPGSFSGKFIWPINGNIVGRFGPVSEGQINQGIEIATGPAEPIRASADGVVAFVGNNVAGYGGMILVRHGSGWITAYGRAARTTVTRGQSIKRGETIGYTGTGSGPQLHFEMRQQRKPVDPLKYLPPV